MTPKEGGRAEAAVRKWGTFATLQEKITSKILNTGNPEIGCPESGCETALKRIIAATIPQQPEGYSQRNTIRCRETIIKTHYLFTMKRLPYLLLLLLALFGGRVTGQGFDPEEYLRVREQNSMLTANGLESLYPLSAEKYYKDFSKAFTPAEVRCLDSVMVKLELTAGEKELLKENLFFVTERLSYSSFGEAFHTVYKYDLPVMVTTDAILHALHMSYDKILKTMEREMMSGYLGEYLQSLYELLPQLAEKYGDDPALRDGLADADLYVTLAYSLITGQLQKGRYADREDIDRVWKAIEGKQMTSLPLFTFPERMRKFDGSQFTVRGHYVYTEEDRMMGFKSLEPYFKAMMWVGRTDFLLTPPPDNPWEKPWSVLEVQRMQIGAFLLNELAGMSDKKELLAFNEQVIDFLVGESDNIMPTEFSAVLEKLGISSARQLADTSLCLLLKETLGSNPELGQKILSDFYLMDPGSDKPGEIPVSYRLSGQRFIIDSYVLGSVVYDRIIHNGNKVMRMMPSPLDALFALGNNDALPFLKEEMEKYPYAGQLANLRYLIDGKPQEFWSASLYNVWLNSIRKLNPGEKEERLPLFMQSAAWHQEKMNSQLASWSQLRHDNLLYAKQSYTGGTGCSYPYSYIEPYPDFYGRLKEFADAAGAFFSQLPSAGYYLVQIAGFFPRFGEVMARLERLAQKELEGLPFTREENEWLQKMLFVESGSGTPPYSGWFASLFFEDWDAAKEDFTVVDVHTQPTDESGIVVGKVLHTGTGKINLGVFLAPSPMEKNRLMAFCGPLFSYYETITTQFKRMTDQEWRQLVWQGKVPARPAWTPLYLAGEKGERPGKGMELPSVMYEGTGSALLAAGGMELRVWPNPVTDKLCLSWMGDAGTAVRVSLHNAAGVLLLDQGRHLTMAGGNSLQLSLGHLPPGIYLLRVAPGNCPPDVAKIIKQ